MTLSQGGVDRRIIGGIFAVVFAGGAVFLAHRWVSEQRRVLAEEWKKVRAEYQAPIQVVVAAKDLPENTILEPSHLQMATIPEKFVQPYALKAPNQAVGKATMAPIAKDEQLLANKLRRPEELPSGSTLSSVTPKGKRAVTIAADAISGVGGFVRPGDIIDILWTIKMPGQGQGDGQVVTWTLFQDISVLAVGGEILGRSAKSAGEQKESRDYTVTLALTPHETSLLLLAREQGRIQLSLRPKGEAGPSHPIPPADIAALLKHVGIELQPPAKPGRRVEVYKGLERNVVALSEGE